MLPVSHLWSPSVILRKCTSDHVSHNSAQNPSRVSPSLRVKGKVLTLTYTFYMTCSRPLLCNLLLLPPAPSPFPACCLLAVTHTKHALPQDLYTCHSLGLNLEMASLPWIILDGGRGVQCNKRLLSRGRQREVDTEEEKAM